MAQIPSSKPIKKCPICGKEVRNLGFHVANQHPRAFDKLDNFNQQQQPPLTNEGIPTEKGGSQSINEDLLRAYYEINKGD